VFFDTPARSTGHQCLLIEILIHLNKTHVNMMINGMDPNAFYNDLQVLTSFNEVSDYTRYTALPDTWYLASSDIRGSTEAIRDGRYKEVTLAGACIIAAMNNLYQKKYLLPYLFGGDGSVIVLPDELIDEARGLLSFCRQAVKNAYGLELATGLVSVREILEKGHEVSAARLRLSDFMDQTVFWGSGVSYAENIIKQKDIPAESEPVQADFTGLECRWNHVPCKSEEIATYMIQALGNSDAEKLQIYDECFRLIDSVYGSENESHPLHENGLSMTTKLRFLKVEWRLKTHASTWKMKLQLITKMIFTFIAGSYLTKFKKKTKSTDWGRYKPDLIKHADYRKFGDSLRFIATGTVQQRMELVSFLEEKFREKKLVYGVQPSFATMITCFVRDHNRNHIHFVDGIDGGYAKASQELKHRLSLLNDHSE
jgi:hypothetical protein